MQYEESRRCYALQLTDKVKPACNEISRGLKIFIFQAGLGLLQAPTDRQ
jgi:hypothetical protein